MQLLTWDEIEDNIYILFNLYDCTGDTPIDRLKLIMIFILDCIGSFIRFLKYFKNAVDNFLVEYFKVKKDCVTIKVKQLSKLQKAELKKYLSKLNSSLYYKDHQKKWIEYYVPSIFTGIWCESIYEISFCFLVFIVFCIGLKTIIKENISIIKNRRNRRKKN